MSLLTFYLVSLCVLAFFALSLSSFAEAQTNVSSSTVDVTTSSSEVANSATATSSSTVVTSSTTTPPQPTSTITSPTTTAAWTTFNPSSSSLNTTTTFALTTTSTAPPSPAPPTPAPFTMLSSSVVDMTWYLSGAASFFSAVGSYPSAPFGISRGMSLVALSNCNLDDEELTFPQSLGSFMKIGVRRGQYLRGAMAGNTFLLITCFCLLYLKGIIWREPSEMKEQDPIWMQLMNGGRVPSYVAIIYALFLDGTVSSSFKLVKISKDETRGKDVVGLLFTIGFQLIFGIFLFRQLSHVRDKLRPMLYLNSEIRFKDKMTAHEYAGRVNSKMARSLMFGRDAWVPYDETLEDFVPAEARRVYHLMFHYRDREVAESAVGRFMPNFYFVDAFFTFLVAAMRGNTVPCVQMLWGVCVVSAVAALFIGLYRPYQIPVVNVVGCVQNIGICFGGMFIQSGVGEHDTGRKMGELIALGSAALGFVPTLIVASRTVLLWTLKAYYSRASRSEEDLEREMKIKERLGIKDIKIEESDKNVRVAGIYAPSLKERELAQKSGGGVTTPQQGLSPNASSHAGNGSFASADGMVGGASPIRRQNQSTSSFSQSASARSFLAYIPPKGSADRDSLLTDSDCGDDDRSALIGERKNKKHKKSKSGASSTAENDSRNGDDFSIINDPHLPTEDKLTRLLEISRNQSDERERKKEELRKKYGVADDEEVVSVDSCFGILTRKPSSRALQQPLAVAASASAYGYRHDDDDDL